MLFDELLKNKHGDNTQMLGLSLTRSGKIGYTIFFS